jgi:hypothetical protein
MKYWIIICLLLVCGTLSSQTFSWDWARPLNGSDGVYCGVTAVDPMNQYYLLLTYEDTLQVGDTTFVQVREILSIIGSWIGILVSALYT